MAAINFKFVSTDKVVQDNLNSKERDLVTRWQTSDDYTFEFHDGHDTGNPIYFRINGNTDKSNAPKIDTLNKSASDYNGKSNGKSPAKVSVSAFRNGNKLSSGLKSAAQRDIEAIVTTSWDHISLLADRHWNAKTPPVVAVEATDKACSATPNCDGRVPIVESGKAPCSVCYKYQ